MADGDLAAEIAEHDERRIAGLDWSFCGQCEMPWPCLVRRLADENGRLRHQAAIAEGVEDNLVADNDRLRSALEAADRRAERRREVRSDG